MQLPDDFGLSAIGTLAHVGSTIPMPSHGSFWARWDEAVLAGRPVLRGRPPSEADATDPSVRLEFESIGHVRIGCRLVMPPAGTAVRLGVVTTHGYEVDQPIAETSRWDGPASAGVATLIVRVRGFPGSWTDCPGPAAEPTGWITHGLGDDDTWVLPRAVADVVLAVGALRDRLGPGVPIALHGESFGGGLAVLAASRLEAHQRPVDRLAIALPSLGDWSWRFAQPLTGGPGAGEQVLAFARLMRDRHDEVLDRVRLADAVIAARTVRQPVLCKLAVFDDVAPAPTQAAVFNALSAPPCGKRRFVVPFGHFDGGLRNARQHALFERAVDVMLDPGLSAWDAVEAAGELWKTARG